MRKSKSAPVAAERRRIANRMWRERWNRFLIASTVAAAVAHLALFGLFPSWEIHQRLAELRSELIQIEPIITPGAHLDEGDTPSAPEQDTEDATEELAEDAGGDGSEVEGSVDNEFFGLATSAVTYPVLPTLAFGQRSPVLPPIQLDQLTAITPQITPSFTVSWPLIRNPTVLTRFLRTRYNPMARTPGANGYVSVAMAIDARGAVEWAEIHESSGHAALDAIAREAFTDVALFNPARNRGSPVPVTVVISVPFTIPW